MKIRINGDINLPECRYFISLKAVLFNNIVIIDIIIHSDMNYQTIFVKSTQSYGFETTASKVMDKLNEGDLNPELREFAKELLELFTFLYMEDFYE
ncbi:MAG: hypothetical protein ACRCX2_38155 [Paraclostridium sp.]